MGCKIEDTVALSKQTGSGCSDLSLLVTDGIDLSFVFLVYLITLCYRFFEAGKRIFYLCLYGFIFFDVFLGLDLLLRHVGQGLFITLDLIRRVLGLLLKIAESGLSLYSLNGIELELLSELLQFNGDGANLVIDVLTVLFGISELVFERFDLLLEFIDLTGTSEDTDAGILKISAGQRSAGIYGITVDTDDLGRMLYLPCDIPGIVQSLGNDDLAEKIGDYILKFGITFNEFGSDTDVPLAG